MLVTFTTADETHVDLLIEMMREFYVHERLALDERAARRALRHILTDESLGRIILLWAGDVAAGYIVLAFGFSLEFHGRDAFVDEIYVTENYRGQGLGRRGLQFVEAVCRELEIKALHLEVDRVNTKAQALYRTIGFADHDRYLLTKWLAQGAERETT